MRQQFTDGIFHTLKNAFQAWIDITRVVHIILPLKCGEVGLETQRTVESWDQTAAKQI